MEGKKEAVVSDRKAAAPRQSPLTDRGCITRLVGFALVLALAQAILFYVQARNLPPPPPAPPGGLPGQRPGLPGAAAAKPAPAPAKPSPGSWTDVPFQPAEIDEGWVPVFTDAFDRAELGANWTRETGGWEVARGALRSQISGTPDSMAVCHGADFSGDLKIAFDCRVVQCDGGPACDVSVMTCLPASRPVQPVGGYLYRFGSNWNTWSGLSCPGGDLVRNEKLVIVPGQKHAVAIVRRGDHLAMTVDGQCVFSGKHKPALSNPKNTWGGFYTFKSVIEIRNFVVSRPGKPGEAAAAPAAATPEAPEKTAPADARADVF